MKALMDTLRKEKIVGVKCWQLKSHLFKALVLPTFTYDTKIQEANLKNSHKKIFEKGMEIHTMSHVCSSTTYHILLVGFGELPTNYMLLAHHGFSTTPCSPTLLLVTQLSNLTFLTHGQMKI
jgi:hypothetical protein